METEVTKVPYKIGWLKKQEFLKVVEKELRHEAFPPQVVVETTAACNLRCIHCGHADMKRRKGNMKEQIWKKIIDEVAATAPHTELWPTFYGEATILRRQLTRWIRYGIDKGLTNIVLNTNGTLLRDEMIEAVFESGLHRLLFSFDGFTKETFEKIRFGANRDYAYRQAEKFLRLKRKRNLRCPEVEMQFSMMDENEHEVEIFQNHWTRLGAYVEVREKLTWTGAKEAPNLYRDLPRIACPWALRTCGIHWNGDVVACAVDYEGGFVAGNVADQSIADIWNGKHRELAALNFEHRFHELPNPCLNCLDWQVGGGATHEPPTDQMSGNLTRE